MQPYDLMKNIRESGITVIGGFHSPMERECLNILLKGKQPIIFCPARSIDGMRIQPEYKTRLDEGRLLILSPFAKEEKRISSERALYRNRFVAALADAILIPHAAANSNTEQLCRDIAIRKNMDIQLSARKMKALLHWALKTHIHIQIFCKEQDKNDR